MQNQYGEPERLSFGDSDEETASGSGILEDPSLSEKAMLMSPTAYNSRFSQFSASFSIPSRPKLVAHCRILLLALLPSYLQRRLTHQSSTPAVERRKNNISALDGLRGIACLFVFNEHYTYNYTTTFLHGYGVGDRRHIVQWPILRIPWSGFSMVAIFYVISGYVLSRKPLRQIRAKDFTSFQSSMTSSVFRRALRLYLPPTIAVLLCAMLVQLHAFRGAARVWDKDNNYLGLHEPPPPQHSTLLAQLVDVVQVSFRLCNVWEWSDDLSHGDYDSHTWTIPVEFRCSMVLFLTLVATARLRQAWRLITISMFIAHCIGTDRRDVLLFISGMLLAELDMIRESHHSNSSIIPRWMPTFRPVLKLKVPKWFLLFVVGLYLASAPVIGCETTPGFVTLVSIFPSTVSDGPAFARSLGAICITWAVANDGGFLKGIFTNAFAAYLGQISFALYLVHGNVLKSVGYASMPLIYAVTGGKDEGAGVGSLVLSWALGLVVVLPVTFWAADLFWRGVDEPCVRFARWVEKRMGDVDDEGVEK